MKNSKEDKKKGGGEEKERSKRCTAHINPKKGES